MKFTKTNPALLCILALLLSVSIATTQDNIGIGSEPIVSSIDPAALAYDYLVDGNLAADDPDKKQFKTLQAAYAAAPAGTEAKPTVIGIKPNVYAISGSMERVPSLSITKDWITLLGLTNNRRAVVLADNRGNQQGAGDNGYIIDVNATGFSAKNLTIINYCNCDYEYPGDPGKNLTRRSNVITQGVALQAAGDKHVYENVALLGRLDTMFLRTTRSYFKNVFIEGTDDWMGGGQVSVWQDCTLVYPEGRGVMSASGVVFINCKFEAAAGMQFYKPEFGSSNRPVALINCVLPANYPEAPVAWFRGMAKPRPNYLSLTYHCTDMMQQPAIIYDDSAGPPAYLCSRELSDAEVKAFNPWNLLRAIPPTLNRRGANPSGNAPEPENATSIVDNWDPAGVREKYEAAGQGDLPTQVRLTGASQYIRTGDAGATIGAAVQPARADQTISWSTDSKLIALSRATGPDIVVTGKNTTELAEWVAVKAAAANGIYALAYVHVQPKYIDPPAVTAQPTLNPPAGGMVTVNYALDLGGRQDQSLVSWFICDDAKGTNARKVSVSRGAQPLKSNSLPLTTGYVGKYLKVTVQPKHQISDPGPEVHAFSAKPVAAADVPSTTIAPNFRFFVADNNDTYVNGLWTIIGNWSIVPADETAGSGSTGANGGGAPAAPLAVSPDKLVNGYGIRPSAPGYLVLQQDADYGDMQVELTLAAEKQGAVFSVPGSPADSGQNNLHSDIFIKYDPRTRNGYALRYWRTTQDAHKCMFQFYKIENGAGSPLDSRQVLTGVMQTRTHLMLKATGNTLTVSAANDSNNETLALESTIAPNRHGGAGIAYPRGSTIIVSRFEISYPTPTPAK